MARLGAGGHDDLLGFHHFLTHLDLPTGAALAHEAAVAVELGHLVFLEQALDAGGQLGHHLILAGHHGGHVNTGLADFDALTGEAVGRFLKQVGSMQQGLGGNAAHVQAGTAEPGFTLGVRIGFGFAAGYGKAQLGRPNGRHITAGATADDENVELLVRHGTPL